MTHIDTLRSPAVTAVIDRLFRESDASEPELDALIAAMPGDERERLRQSRTEYRAFYARLKEFALPVSRETGTLLYALARGAGARTIVEFGTSFGISTLHLASALRDNGGGLLITTEFEATKTARARANLAEAGLADLVEFREGDAVQTLATGLPETIDMLVLDGAKPLYPDILRAIEPRLRPGAFVLADDADRSPEFLAIVRAGDGGYVSAPAGEDVELSVRTV